MDEPKYEVRELHKLDQFVKGNKTSLQKSELAGFYSYLEVQLTMTHACSCCMLICRLCIS
jgi:hypothetical protein